MSFIKRAQEAAQTAAEQARQLAGDAASGASRTASDPVLQGQVMDSLSSAGRAAREAAGVARKGLSTVVEKIDPGTLADLIIKATALQELTNDALRKKGSPYRISEVGIAATIPPGVNFSIGRISDPEEVVGAPEIASTELVGALDGEAVIALDGTTVDETAV